MARAKRPVQPKPTVPKATIVVHGMDEHGKPRAARFPGDQIDLVNKAAALMGLRLVKVTTAELAEVAQKLPGGRIYSNGRGFVPYVRHELYANLIATASGHTGGKIGSSSGSPVPKTWDDIATGHLVIAAEDSGPLEGWWEAIVVGRDADMLTLKWRDHPREPSFKRHRLSVALMDPGAHQQAPTTKAANPKGGTTEHPSS